MWLLEIKRKIKNTLFVSVSLSFRKIWHSLNKNNADDRELQGERTTVGWQASFVASLFAFLETELGVDRLLIGLSSIFY